MSDGQDARPARVSRMRRVSSLWLIPLVTVVVAMVMVVRNYQGQGPLITIRLETAAGLEAGRTLIRTLDVEVGQVEDITLGEDLDSVLVTARIHGEFRDLLAEDSRFWVVQPSISLAGISGLNTLISGQYIRFAPGTAERTATDFVGLEEPPVTPPGTPGLHVTLVTDGDFAFATGDQVHFQGLTVGKIEDIRYDLVNARVYYDAFIEAPFHELITTDTRFWQSSGVRAELTTDGFEVESGTLDTLLAGGVSFITPRESLQAETLTVQTEFYVYPNRNAIDQRQFDHAIRYWILVSDSVGGLSEDSRVMYRGIQVGRVVRTDYIPEGRNLLDRTLELPVLIEIQPARLGLPDSEDGAARAQEEMDQWIRDGLVATLKSQNFLLGQQQVDLEYQEDATRETVEQFNGLAVIPTDLNEIGRFTSSIEALLTKLNEMPLEPALQGVEQLSRDASSALASMQDLLETTHDMIGSDNSEALLAQLDATLGSLQALAESFSAESRTTLEVQRALDAVTGLMNEFRPLAAELRNRPSSLIFPAPGQSEAEPTRKQP